MMIIWLCLAFICFGWAITAHIGLFAPGLTASKREHLARLATLLDVMTAVSVYFVIERLIR